MGSKAILDSNLIKTIIIYIEIESSIIFRNKQGKVCSKTFRRANSTFGKVFIIILSKNLEFAMR